MSRLRNPDRTDGAGVSRYPDRGQPSSIAGSPEALITLLILLALPGCSPVEPDRVSGGGSGATREANSIRLPDLLGTAVSSHSVSESSPTTEKTPLPQAAWRGLFGVYRESLVTHAPTRLSFTVPIPEKAWLDLALGTMEDGEATFRVEVAGGDPSSGSPHRVLERTLTRANQWVPSPLDLSRHAGRTVTLSLLFDSPHPGVTGLWGTAAIRQGVEEDHEEMESPRGIVLIVADTLRADHLDWQGYERETAPFLATLASDGTVFRDCVAQATWTKPSVTSLLTSLYPTTHAVTEQRAHLPDPARTLAEEFREAGWATLGMASIPLVGEMSNLQQGFEEFHEASSLQASPRAKTAHELVGRLLPWLEVHRRSPFFVLLHVADPHGPYEPLPPYDTWWGEPGASDTLAELKERVQRRIEDPLLRELALPRREELVAAGIDPERYVDLEIDGYDGSIRGMDSELRRVFERLQDLSLARSVLIVFTSDHGEEFLEHGAHSHGHSVYGELSRVPLVFWGPRWLPTDAVVDQTVRSIDIMPTILELADLEIPSTVQGRSLVTFFDSERAPRPSRPVVTEKAIMVGRHPLPESDYRSVAIVDGEWKLIRHRPPPEGGPEYELYRRNDDPAETVDVAGEHPEVVERLAGAIDSWEKTAASARLGSADGSAEDLDEEARAKLQALGYLGDTP